MPTHHMVTCAKAGIFKLLEHMNCHVTTTSPIPRSHVHALRDSNWKEAMLDEYNALIINRTWVLVPRPANVNVVHSMWLFKHKFNVDGSLSSDLCMGLSKPRVLGFNDLLVMLHELVFSVHHLQHFYSGSSLPSTSQSKFAKEILERAHMQNSNPYRTPVDIESKLGSDGDPVSNPTLYRSLAGALQYLTFTRPDVSYVVQQLSAYTDVDWAGCPVTCRSTSGYCVFLGDNLLSWSAKPQVTLSCSSVKAEYQGVSNVVAETEWIRTLLCELHAPLFTATLVYCDNVSVVYMSANPVQHQRTKETQ
ncbi:ribonuclease H-like domain-containing protein [Tanacetum coccineum]